MGMRITSYDRIPSVWSRPSINGCFFMDLVEFFCDVKSGFPELPAESQGVCGKCCSRGALRSRDGCGAERRRFFGGPAAPRATMRRHTRGRTHVRAAARTRTTSCAACVFSAHHRRLSAPHITTNHPGAIGIGVSNCALGTRLSFRKNTGVGVGSVSFRKDTPTRAQREHHPDARRPAHSRPRAHLAAP